MAADVVVEDVPKFVRRYGDQVIEGSNNTIIILGTDRAKNGPASISDGIGHVKAPGGGKGAGTIHLIAGRADKEPDFSKDDSFIYLTRKSKVDDNLDLGKVEKAQNNVPAAIIKSDSVRIIGRNDIKICTNDDQKHYVFIDRDKVIVRMGDNQIEMDASHAKVTVANTKLTMSNGLIKIDSPKVQLTGGCESPWDDLFKEIINMLQNHDHMSAVGPTTPAVAGPQGPSLVPQVQAKKGAWDAKVKS